MWSCTWLKAVNHLFWGEHKRPLRVYSAGENAYKNAPVLQWCCSGWCFKDLYLLIRSWKYATEEMEYNFIQNNAQSAYFETLKKELTSHLCYIVKAHG